MYYIVSSNELYHHGILGQKWGVRRFQNPDGSLTEAGKKRYFAKYDKSSYELNEKGKRIENREYLNRYTNNKRESLDQRMARIKKEANNEAWFDKSTNELNSVIKNGNRILENGNTVKINALQKHLDAINSGELFTRTYYTTKLYAALETAKYDAAEKILKERKRLYQEAKKKDQYSFDYLEMISDEISQGPQKERLANYNRWLNDPKKWREERYKH